MSTPNNTDDIITDIIAREGGLVNDVLDKGGKTQFGISQQFKDAWADGKVTEAEARAIYESKFLVGPGFDRIPDAGLRAQLVDYGVNSGPAIAIQKLQAIIGVAPDGALGAATLAALGTQDVRTVNNALVAARIRMIGRLVQKTPTQLKFLSGWLDRALQFLR